MSADDRLASREAMRDDLRRDPGVTIGRGRASAYVAYGRPTLRALVPKLLWIDCIGGLAVGLIVVALHRPLAGWYGLPMQLMLATGVANLVYGAASLTLATRARRPIEYIGALAGANVAWAAVCGVLVARYAATAGVLGMIHLAAEGLYVGALGALEWRYRRELLVRAAR